PGSIVSSTSTSTPLHSIDDPVSDLDGNAFAYPTSSGAKKFHGGGKRAMRRAEKPPCRTFGVLFPERHPPDTAIQRQGLPPDAIHGTGPPTPSAARDFRSTTIPAGKPGDRRQQILPEPALQPTEKPARDADRVEYCRHPDAGTSRWIRKSQKESRRPRGRKSAPQTPVP